MNKTINTLVSIFIGTTLLVFSACSDDDNNNYEVTQEWKDYQANVVTRIAKLASTGEDGYQSVKSVSEQGTVYYKPSTYITEHMKGNFETDEPSAFPKEKRLVKLTKLEYDTDSVVVRYEGWFYTLEGKRIPFDSTEIEVLTGISKNNNQKATFVISNVIDGFRTILKEMSVGDEYIAGFSHELGYGQYGSTQGSISIPGYSTLFFDVKLLEVKRAKAK